MRVRDPVSTNPLISRTMAKHRAWEASAQTVQQSKGRGPRGEIPGTARRKPGRPIRHPALLPVSRPC